VIRIFGIFTLAQIHHARFWDSLSRQLQRRGRDYIERCTFRNKPSTGGYVVLPAMFPHLPDDVQDLPQTEQPVKVSDDDMKDVSEIASILTDTYQVHMR
jgi:hypothetical protein